MKLLEISNLHSGYGHLHVLRGVSLEIMAGECVALLGPNGAGKTTLLRTIAGLLQPWSGEIALMGKPIDRLPTHQIIRMGLGFITEKSNLFAGMSVWENLILGSHYMHDGDKSKAIQNIDYVLDLFPVLAERKKQLAGTLSGGERKMLAIGRGLMSSPQLILVDEPSLGLAPNLVRMVFEALKRLHQRGVTILIIEQNVGMSLQNADRGYILEQGQIVMKGYSKELLRSVHVKNAYLGIT